MPKYVDGFVIPIRKTSFKQYRKMAALGRKLWLEYGALDYYECVGDDLQEKWGLPFRKLCKLKPGETVVFAFIVFRSKADRNRINARVYQDPRMQPGDMKQMPFDMKRFTMGGFKAFVET